LSKREEFVAIVNSKVGSGYVWDGQNDDILTREKLDKLVSIFGRSHYYFNGYSAEKWFGYEYYDCSGLIIYTLRRLELIPKTADYTTDGIFRNLCKEIKKSELKPGDLCFVPNTSGVMVHVAVFIGNNKVTHAQNTKNGVVTTDLVKSFSRFGRLKFFEEEDNMFEDKLFKDDAQIASWAKEAVYALKEKGIIAGDGTGHFYPKNPSTREELAVALHKLLKYLGKD